MLVMFLATTCGAGGALTAIDSMGHIGQALGGAAAVTAPNPVAVDSHGGAACRLRRPPLHLLVALDRRAAVHALRGVRAHGFCFGAQWPLLYAIISELFGTYMLNVRVAGRQGSTAGGSPAPTRRVSASSASGRRS
ncbi:hypothetical protein EJB05_25978, partial [Eragrostis curvula]